KEIGYVTSGRVLAAAPPKHKPSAPVVVADPDFDHGVPSGTGGGAFAALMASAAEAEMVAPKIAKYAGVDPKVFTREGASEAAGNRTGCAQRLPDWAGRAAGRPRRDGPSPGLSSGRSRRGHGRALVDQRR